ncbi:glycosyltransferase family 4 protein [Antarcticirhabdus aurantiaca]|uniref:Glycosyltransferase family 4 protein n=1 Tax=Antarcticirhabdus aurantiaca TaxID=2606717 RepID=A0ACD4NQP3_9HYPH|nr:glycosyltransferase family 4 protein [Antarcticirhabdus aurantiaca]WAJ29183.1 glycosyltransferase family 4 protein [Jeongeuplla avenae]
MISRIVILNDASIARGGATGLALLSIRLLRQRGFDVTYIVGDKGDNEELERLGVEVVSVGGAPLVKQNPVAAFARGAFNPAARKTVADWVRTRDTPSTVYHVHGWSKILTPSIFSALGPVAARTVIHAHDFFLACPNGAFMDYKRGEPCERVPLSASCLSTNCDKRNYAQKLWRSARKRVLDSTFPQSLPWAAVAMIHEKMAPYLVKGGVSSGRLVTVRNPAEPFSRSRIPSEANGTVFFVGRVEAEKGVVELLAAARSAGVPLAVIGDGPLRKELSKQYPDVRFHGWRNREEIAELLRSARGVVMPSRYPEPYGLVAAEASGSGLPVLVSRTAFLREEILANGLGFSFDLNDPADIAGTLRSLVDLPAEEVRAMSERGHSGEASLSQTPDEWIDALLRLYSATLVRPPLPSAA